MRRRWEEILTNNGESENLVLLSQVEVGEEVLGPSKIIFSWEKYFSFDGKVAHDRKARMRISHCTLGSG